MSILSETKRNEDGSYSTIHYKNYKGEDCDKETATICIVRSYDSNCKLTAEINDHTKNYGKDNKNKL